MKNASSLFCLDSFLGHQDDAYHVARTTISSEDDLVLHHHDYAEVFWIKEGSGIHLINGQESPLTPGTLLMIRPADTHTFRLASPGKGMVITNIAFNKKSLDHFRERYFTDSNTFFWTEESLPFTTQISSDQLNELSALTDRLLNRPKDHLHLDHIMLHIFSFLTNMESGQSQLPHWLAYALENYNTPQQFKNGIEGFVALCTRSTDHINRTLQKHLKQSLSETVNKVRLDYAARQLTMTNAPIKTICFECGYDNISYFYRLFKKFYGITPAEYREKNHKIF